MSSYVDATVIHSVLAGLLVAAALPWALYFFSRLQQDWLEEASAGALDALGKHGLALAPAGLRSRLVAVGQDLRIEWRTGVLGPRTVVRRGDQRRVLPLVRTADELGRALEG